MNDPFELLEDDDELELDDEEDDADDLGGDFDRAYRHPIQRGSPRAHQLEA